MVFAPICGVSHACGEPTGKNKVVCDYLYKELVDTISDMGGYWQYASRENITFLACNKCNLEGVNYLVWRISFSDSRFDRIVLILNPFTTHAENEADNSHVCDFWGAFDSYWKLFSKGATSEELRNCSYPLLFFDLKKYKDMIKSDSEIHGVTVTEFAVFDKTGRKLKWAL